MSSISLKLDTAAARGGIVEGAFALAVELLAKNLTSSGRAVHAVLADGSTREGHVYDVWGGTIGIGDQRVGSSSIIEFCVD